MRRKKSIIITPLTIKQQEQGDSPSNTAYSSQTVEKRLIGVR